MDDLYCIDCQEDITETEADGNGVRCDRCYEDYIKQPQGGRDE